VTDHPTGKTFGERMSDRLGEDVFGEAMAGLAQSAADPSALDGRPLWDRLPARPVNANEVAVVLPTDRRMKVYGTFYKKEYEPGETGFSRLLVEAERFHHLTRRNSRVGAWERVERYEKSEPVKAGNASEMRTFSHWLARRVADEELSWPGRELNSYEGENGVTMWPLAGVRESSERAVRRGDSLVSLSDEQVRDLRERLVVEVDA
jgi:hypothetical protein